MIGKLTADFADFADFGVGCMWATRVTEMLGLGWSLAPPFNRWLSQKSRVLYKQDVLRFPTLLFLSDFLFGGFYGACQR